MSCTQIPVPLSVIFHASPPFNYGCIKRLLTPLLTLKVLVTTIDAQWEGIWDVGSARYEQALLPHARPQGF